MLYVSSLPQVRDFAHHQAFRIDSSSLIPFIEKELLHIDLLNSFVPQMQNTFGNIKKPSAHQRLSERNHDLRQASKALSNERTDRQIDSFDKTEH